MSYYKAYDDFRERYEKFREIGKQKPLEPYGTYYLKIIRLFNFGLLKFKFKHLTDTGITSMQRNKVHFKPIFIKILNNSR